MLIGVLVGVCEKWLFLLLFYDVVIEVFSFFSLPFLLCFKVLLVDDNRKFG